MGNNKFHITFSLPETSRSELLGKQSVRATFKLTEKAIETLSVVSIQLGVKQKSLFDHLIDDLSALEMIAKDVEPSGFQQLNRVQKTFVLSRKTLSSLEKASRIFDAPRDALVEYSIQRLRPIIEQERKKHEKRKMVLEKLTTHLQGGEQLLAEAWNILGETDPLTVRIASVIASYKSAHDQISSHIEKSRCIEQFE
ncbi:MAG: hypothetical protein HKM93_06175 [Desulfobacteraceae bacterium]|nr:hypothetical protein [Desulfobacteraceae bacterium]